jgi:hypothetical protein
LEIETDGHILPRSKGRKLGIKRKVTELDMADVKTLFRQNEIHDILFLGFETVQRAVLEKYPDMVIRSQVLAANVQAAVAVLQCPVDKNILRPMSSSCW